jgi:hypothetical protein
MASMVHTETDQPARRPLGCAVVASTLAARDAMGVGDKARPTPADDKRARRFDVVHRPSRPWSLASQTAPPHHQSGHPPTTPRRTIKLSSETRLLTNNSLPTPRRTTLC